MVHYTRNIHIYTQKNEEPLNAAQQLVVFFAPGPTESTVPSFTPVTWKTIVFPANQDSQATITWSTECGFIASLIRDDGTIIAASATPIELGYSTILTGDTVQGHSWSNPISQPVKETFVAHNQSGTRKDIALGMVTRKSPLQVEPMILFKELPSTNQANARECPMMQAYAVQGMHTIHGIGKREWKDHQIFSPSYGSPLFGEDGLNMRSLSKDTHFLMFTHPVTGAATLKNISPTKKGLFEAAEESEEKLDASE